MSAMRVEGLRIDVLMTCHNRREMTVASIHGLGEIASLLQGVHFSVFVVDDGSTDGTADAVITTFPEVSLIEGNGSLYWAGGMGLAFRLARSEAHADAYLLVNDDVRLEPMAAAGLVAAWIQRRESPHILVGKTTDKLGSSVTYAGFTDTSRWSVFGFTPVVAEKGEPEACDTFNANFVLVPGEFFRSVGGLDPVYRHGAADLDLGLVAARSGVPSLVWPTAIGTCDRGPATELLLRRLSRRERAVKLFVHPYGLAPDAHFAWKHRPRWLLPLYLGVGVLRRLRQLIPAQDPRAGSRQAPRDPGAMR